MQESKGWFLRLCRSLVLAALAVSAALSGAAAQDFAFSLPGGQEQGETPTIEQYVAHAGNATVAGVGELRFDGRRMVCGQRPTVLDEKLDDYGAAYPGFLILNPKLLSKVAPVVRMWIYSHECGHQFRGPDEMTADCFAVQRGRRYGWLDEAGLEEICRFISPAKGDNAHFAGPYRCEAMRKCFADSKIH